MGKPPPKSKYRRKPGATKGPTDRQAIVDYRAGADTCPTCKGKGTVDLEPCSDCLGEGRT